MLVAASVAALVVGALVLARFASAPSENGDEDQSESSEQFAAAPGAEPVRATPAPADMTVASAGIAGPVVTERPAAPAVKARPAKAATVKPERARVAAPVNASANASVKSTAPIAPTAIDKVSARGDAAATNVRAASVSTETVGPAPVTVTGCLEMSVDRDEFRLTDTDGADAPRSRSWRTGFLKKRPAPVALVEPTDPHGLQKEVGKRVAATGQLTDRELKVSSVRVVGASCD